MCVFLHRQIVLNFIEDGPILDNIMTLLSSLISVIVLVVAGIFALLFFFQTRLIFIPERLDQNHKFQFLHSHEEGYVTGSDDVKLHYLKFAPKPEAKGAVVYFHGNAGSLASWGEVAADFLIHDQTVFILDYRGYGKSQGNLPNEEEFYQDALAFYDMINKDFKESDITVYGRSIGSAAAAFLAKERQPEKVVFESPFDSFTRLAKHHYPFAPAFLLRYRFPVIDYLKESSSNITLIHGTNDKVIPHEASLRLKDALPKSRLFLIERMGHNDLAQSKEYHSLLGRIFQDASSKTKGGKWQN